MLSCHQLLACFLFRDKGEFIVAAFAVAVSVVDASVNCFIAVAVAVA
jgi:hypothetical protein